MARLSPGKRVLFSVMTICLLLGMTLECGQRVSDWRIARKRSGRAVAPYLIRPVSSTGAELADRWAPIAVQHHPYLVYKALPSQDVTGVQRASAEDPGVDVRIRINAHGFRGGEWTVAKPAGVRRVAILGGSAAFGQGATGEAGSLAGQLERALAEAEPGEPRVEVLNLAQIAYSSDQERVLLATEATAFSLDAVVLFDGWNDFFYSAIRPDSPAGLAEDSPLRRVQPLFDEFDRQMVRGRDRWAAALRLSAFYRSVERGLEGSAPGRLRNPADPAEAAFFDRPAAATAYGRNIAAMVRIARAFGARVVVAPQPEPFQRTAPPESQRRIDARLSPAWADLARRRYPAFVEAARAAAASEQAPFVDCSRAFDGRPELLFIDEVHFDDAGGRVLAERLLPEVRAALAGR